MLYSVVCVLCAQEGPALAGGEGAKGHTVSVEVVSVTHGHPVGVLELNVVPRPLVIDRTFRCAAVSCLSLIMRHTHRHHTLAGCTVFFCGVGPGCGLIASCFEQAMVMKYKWKDCPVLAQLVMIIVL